MAVTGLFYGVALTWRCPGTAMSWCPTVSVSHVIRVTENAHLSISVFTGVIISNSCSPPRFYIVTHFAKPLMGHRGKRMNFWACWTWIEFWLCHVLAVWPWMIHLTSLSLRSFTCWQMATRAPRSEGLMKWWVGMVATVPGMHWT